MAVQSGVGVVIVAVGNVVVSQHPSHLLLAESESTKSLAHCIEVEHLGVELLLQLDDLGANGLGLVESGQRVLGLGQQQREQSITGIGAQSIEGTLTRLSLVATFVATLEASFVAVLRSDVVLSRPKDGISASCSRRSGCA